MVWIVIRMGKLLRLLEDRWPFILVDRLSTLSHIEGITLGAGQEVDVCVLHNLLPNTNHITCCHLELAYQFVVSSRHSHGINLS